jgi:hypothetical protein
MSLHQEPLSPYEEMQHQLNKICQGFNITGSQVEAIFAEFLLDYAGVEERVTRVRIESYPGGKDLVLQMNKLSPAAFKILLNLSIKVPGIDITNLSGIFIHGRSLWIDPVRDMGVKLNAAVVKEHLLPLFSAYITNHPDVVQHYVKEKSAVGHSDLVKQLNTILQPEGINTSKTDCYEETICLMVKEYYENLANVLTQAPSILLAFHFSESLIRLMMGYLEEVLEINQYHVRGITTTCSQFWPTRFNSSATNFRLTTPPDSARYIAAFFNRANPRIARLDNDSLGFVIYDKERPTSVTVANYALTDKEFIAEFTQRVRSLPHDTKAHYRKLCGRTEYSVDECLQKLEKFKNDLLKDDEDHSKLTASIQLLLDMIKKVGVEHDSVKKQLQSMLGAKNIFSLMGAGVKGLFSKIGLLNEECSPGKPDFQEYKKILQILDVIANKRFAVEAKREMPHYPPMTQTVRR